MTASGNVINWKIGITWRHRWQLLSNSLFDWLRPILAHFLGFIIYRALLGLWGTLEWVHLRRLLCRKSAPVQQIPVKSCEHCKRFGYHAPLHTMQSVGIKRYKAWSKRIDGSITEKHSSFHYGELRESAGNGDNFVWAHLFRQIGRMRRITFLWNRGVRHVSARLFG